MVPARPPAGVGFCPAEQARLVRKQPGMKTNIPAVLAFGVATLTAATALPCSIAFEEPIVPNPWTSAEVPVDGVVFLRSEWGDQLTRYDLVDPDGDPVEWEFETSAIHPDIEEARPVGGWLVGEYRYADSDLDEAPIYTVIDEVDEETPTFEIVAWEGNSEKFVLAPCGGGRQESGVYVQLSEPEEPVVYTWELLGVTEADVQITGVFIGWDRFIPTPLGAEFSVRIEAFDLSGNSSVQTTGEVVACDGCSGSMSAGSATSGFGLLGALLLVTRRRRTIAIGRASTSTS